MSAGGDHNSDQLYELIKNAGG